MEAVGARLGRSSTRYGQPTVFTGPVRRWKKKWVHLSSPNSANNHSHQANGTNGNNGSHLLLYKWTPITQSTNNNNTNNGDKNSGKDENPDDTSPEEPPRRKFRYVPVAVLEEEKKEASEPLDEEVKPIETDPSDGVTPKGDGSNEKPDINDVPMEETQESHKDQSARQDLNETQLDLSLGLNGHDGEENPNPNPNSNSNPNLNPNPNPKTEDSSKES